MPSTRSSKTVDGPAPEVAALTKSVGMDWTPTPYQQAIGDWFKTGLGRNLVVEAVAGGTKTSTILWAIQFAPEQRILLAAFNKRIQQELADRLTNPNAEARTIHSLGYRAIRNAGGVTKMCERKFEREDHIADTVTKGMPFGAKRLVAKLVTKAREIQPLGATVASLINLAYDFDLIPPSGEALTTEMVARATLNGLEFARLAPRQTGIDNADMIFLPLVNDWLTAEFDMGVVDEAQDMVLAQLELFQRCIKPGGRIVVIGDSHQAIYGFRGADSKSLSRLKEELQADALPLSCSYRCPQLVVAEAKHYVPHIEAAPAAPMGVISTIADRDELLAAVKPGEFVLSRVNRPLVSLAMKLLKQGRRAKVQGRDIGDGLLALIKHLAKGSAAHSMPEFLRKLEGYHQQTRTRLIAAKHEEKLEPLQDKVDMLNQLAEDCPGVPTLQDRISDLFTNEPGDAVVFSTVHKAKGLESDRVYILRSTFGLPIPCECGHRHKGPTCKTCGCDSYVPDREKQQEEQNIKYVAITRAKWELTWCEGDY